MNKNLAFYRKDLGLTQIEFSQASRVPRYKIQLCERYIKCLTESEANRIFKKLDIPGNELPEWLKDLIEGENYE